MNLKSIYSHKIILLSFLPLHLPTINYEWKFVLNFYLSGKLIG